MRIPRAGGNGSSPGAFAAGHQTLHYRCPFCHYMADAWTLFNVCCPFCGWVSPLGERREEAADFRGAYLDVVYEKCFVRITTEMPAAEAEQIALAVKGDTVRITARNLDRIVYLRHPVEDEAIQTYRNGVLEIVLKARGQATGEKRW